jgi:predicted ATPase
MKIFRAGRIRLSRNRFYDCNDLKLATHSPILMAYPDEAIYLCSKDGIIPIDDVEINFAAKPN